MAHGGMALAQASSAMLHFQGKLLKRAAEICGGWDLLRAQLGVSQESMKLWSDGKARLPDRAFLRVADLVLEDDIARAAQDRRNQPRIHAVRQNSESIAPGGSEA